MGISLGAGHTKRDISKIASSGAEVFLQLSTLGSAGLPSAVAPMFRLMNGLRGEDSLERIATKLIMDVISYAIVTTFTNSDLERSPTEEELKKIIESFLSRVDHLVDQNEVVLTAEHISRPSTFPLFVDAADRIGHEIRRFSSAKVANNASAEFRRATEEGFARIRNRAPDSYWIVLDALAGAETTAEARVSAWDEYRSALINRFENEPLFGEDPETGVSLGQVYQPLRAYWVEEKPLTLEESVSQDLSDSDKENKYHFDFLYSQVDSWLNSYTKGDRTRLVSGGPGSGKSTFAKYLAAKLSEDLKWRVIFVPLQRIRGTGSLSRRIDEYFIEHRDEPFSSEVSPISEIGRDGHKDWVIIFDGLDELAKEGERSETAAQEFASALSDMMGTIGSEVFLRCIILGRAPSMQEASRRLSLDGPKTLHVVSLIPLNENAQSRRRQNLDISDPNSVCDIDQRILFWKKWASSKKISTDLPDGLTEEALVDLTKEPLLLYLLIVSEYIGEKWVKAAENRNVVYHSIFKKIWDRERSKSTPQREALSEFGKDGFEAIMQCLGVAAWRGGGRTGDEKTFSNVREVFLPRNLKDQAEALGVYDLDNVALLFYTQKDESAGRGYEFLHKSFGEFLTAGALYSAFLRWGEQVIAANIDIDEKGFCERWLQLTGANRLTNEVLSFLRNEVRLRAAQANSRKPWLAARDWVRIAEKILSFVVESGLPAQSISERWREAERQEKNAEVSLLAITDAVARAAYPIDLLNKEPENGGWLAGPVEIESFRQDSNAFRNFIARIGSLPAGILMVDGHFLGAVTGDVVSSCLSRFSLDLCNISSIVFSEAEIDGCSFKGANMVCSTFADSSFIGSDFSNSELFGANIFSCVMSYSSFYNTGLNYATISSSDLSKCNLEGARLKELKIVDSILTGAKLKGTGLRQNQKNRRRRNPFGARDIVV